MLFTAEELAEYLGTTVTEARAYMVERIVWGWLKPVLALTDRPDPVSDEVFSWAIELAAIVHENPAGLSSQQLGPGSQTYSLERRQEILAEVAAGGGSITTVHAPQGSFPDALDYPDGAW